jgi:hypothetical protein
MENALSSVDQRKQDLREELNARIEATQRDLEMSLSTRTRGFDE